MSDPKDWAEKFVGPQLVEGRVVWLAYDETQSDVIGEFASKQLALDAVRVYADRLEVE